MYFTNLPIIENANYIYLTFNKHVPLLFCVSRHLISDVIDIENKYSRMVVTKKCENKYYFIFSITHKNKMDYRLSVLAVVLGVAAIALSADEKSSTPVPEAEGTIRIYRRLIPADVLRGLLKYFKYIEFVAFNLNVITYNR